MLAAGSAATAAWLAADAPILAAQPDLSSKTAEMLGWTAAEFIAARRAGTTTCRAYAETLLTRAAFYADMNIFETGSRTPAAAATILALADELDEKAATHGVEALAPLYCLPVPVKGTMATVDFPSSAGAARLADTPAVKDAGMVVLLKNAHGLPFGKTNTPEFAGSWVTINPTHGRTINAYHPLLTAGGSSGGSGAAVAFHIGAVAITEDTGGSTRHPSYQVRRSL